MRNMFSVKISLGTHFAEIKKEVKKMCNNIFYTEKKKKASSFISESKKLYLVFQKTSNFKPTFSYSYNN